LLFESERGEGHRIETFANARIAGSKFAILLQRNLLPKPREMQNAKRPGNSGADQWNVCITHIFWVLMLWLNVSERLIKFTRHTIASTAN
jgi:hypothetical protein